jgi:hypothetical protein
VLQAFSVRRLDKAEPAVKLIELGLSSVVVQQQRKGITTVEHCCSMPPLSHSVAVHTRGHTGRTEVEGCVIPAPSTTRPKPTPRLV